MRFKFITLNLWLGGMLFDSILNFLKKENPDILLCQEVYNGDNKKLEKRYRSFKIIKEKIKFKDAVFAPAFGENLGKVGKVPSGNAIFSKYPILKTKTVFYDIPYSDNYAKRGEVKDFAPYIPRNLISAVLKAGKIKLNIFNTQGIWGFRDGKDNKRRLEMGKKIIREIKSKENVILAGDFNLSPDTKTIALVEKHLRNVFKNELITSFNMKRKTDRGYAKAVVDMVFADHKIKTIDHYCPQIDVSDHLPLVCMFEV